jgi:hypothetical protein
MRFSHFVGHTSDPLVQRNVGIARALEHLEKYKIFSPVFATLWPAIVGTYPTSFALKSMVLAWAPVVTTVMRPLPRIQYCHSLTLGCQCISRMAPGLSVTMAAAI